MYVCLVLVTLLCPRLPPASPLPPAVVMKLDVEGRSAHATNANAEMDADTNANTEVDAAANVDAHREVSIVPDLVMSGALRHLANLHVDWTV